MGCANDDLPAEPQTYVVPVFAQGGNAKNFGTHLTGDAERPTPHDSKAQGQAIFQVQSDGTVSYRLNVANIENVTQAHIHCCAGENATAGISVWLYPSAPPLSLIPGRSQGTLASGVITDAQVIGALAGTGVAGLLVAIQAGNAYVNVHTSQFPPGEVRGQLN
jgi:hypothetical protein